MNCAVCATNNQMEFPAEITIHFRGLKNVAKPGVHVFPKLLVCLDCGSAQFTVPKDGLDRLRKGIGS
jgi:hypothetical protein